MKKLQNSDFKISQNIKIKNFKQKHFFYKKNIKFVVKFAIKI